MRLILQGGRYPLDGPVKERQNQRVIVELVCAKDLEGTEGEWQVEEYDRGDGSTEPSKKTPDAPDAPDAPANETMVADGDAGFSTREDHPGERQLVREGEDPALVFESYDVHDADGAYGTLRLTWKTKYACESVANARREHWGFFTWFVILYVLLFFLGSPPQPRLL